MLGGTSAGTTHKVKTLKHITRLNEKLIRLIREQLVENTGKSQHVPDTNLPLAPVMETKGEQPLVTQN